MQKSVQLLAQFMFSILQMSGNYQRQTDIVNVKLPGVQAAVLKARGNRWRVSIHWIIKEKNINFSFIDCMKNFDCNGFYNKLY